MMLSGFGRRTAGSPTVPNGGGGAIPTPADTGGGAMREPGAFASSSSSSSESGLAIKRFGMRRVDCIFLGPDTDAWRVIPVPTGDRRDMPDMLDEAKT